MIHINPIEYPNLNKRDFTVISRDSDRKLTISNINNARIFYGKKLSFIINGSTYTGRYTYSYINESLKHHIIFDSNLPSTIKANSTLSIYETFIVHEDNQALTFQDLHEKFNSTKIEASVDFDGINDIGSLNLVDGFETLKIDSTNYAFKLKRAITLNNKTEICKFKIFDNKLSNFKVVLHDNSGLFICVEIFIEDIGNSQYYIINHSHFNQSKGFENELNQYSDTNLTVVNNIKLQLIKEKYADQNYVKLVLNNTDSESHILTGYIACKHPEDLWAPESVAADETETLLLNSDETITIDQTLLFADKYGEQRTINYGESLIKSIQVDSNFNIVDLPVGYYKVIKDKAPHGIPGISYTNENQTKDLSENDFSELFWSSGDLIIMHNDKYMFYSDNKHIFIGHLWGTKDVKWSLVSVLGHTHSLDEIKEGETNKFVNQEDIDKWNQTTNNLNKLSWISKEYPYSKLTDKSGNVILRISTDTETNNYANNPIIFANDNGTVVPVSIGALTVENQKVKNPYLTGTLIKQETIDKLNGLGIGLRVPDTDQYLLITNKIDWYNISTNQNKTFFDLVKRTGNTTIGNNSLNIGIYNTVAKDNSIFYGVGLSSNKPNTTIIGKYNKELIADIIFGIGTSNTDRKNAFWYLNNTFLISGKLNLPDYPAGYILVNDNEPIPNTFVQKRDFEDFKEQLDFIDSPAITILVPADITKNNIYLNPLVQDYEEIIYSICIYNLLNSDYDLKDENTKIYSKDYSGYEDAREEVINDSEGEEDLTFTEYIESLDWNEEDFSIEDGQNYILISLKLNSQIKVEASGLTKIYNIDTSLIDFEDFNREIKINF